jgi:SAM-dependent methyltransferase
MAAVSPRIPASESRDALEGRGAEINSYREVFFMRCNRAVPVALFALCFGIVVGAQAADHVKQHHGMDMSHSDHMQRRFDDPEKWAKSFDDPARDAWQLPERVIQTLALKPGQSVADIGAGTGYFTVRLAKASAALTVYAVDIEPSMIGYLGKRAQKENLKNVVPVLAAPDKTNLPQPVDLIVAVNTYHHIPNRIPYFRELREQMKPSARLVIIDWRKDSPDGPPPEFRFTPEQIGAELSKAGFIFSAKHDFLPRQHFLIYQADSK